MTDALRRLEGDGLVESRPRAGTRVRVPSDRHPRSRTSCARRSRSQSARLFAARATPAQRVELTTLADQVDAFFRELGSRSERFGSRFKVHRRHVRFHLTIAEHARSRLLTQMIERNHVLMLNWLFDVSARRTPLPRHFHAQLAKALVSGDAERADTAMRAHVRYGLSEITGEFQRAAASEWRERPRAQRRARG